MKNLYRFFYKLFLIVCILFVVDYLAGLSLKQMYFGQTSGTYYRTSYSISETNADLLIFGSSKAIHYYNPSVFEDSLHLSCYNVGKEGLEMFYHYAILKSVLQRYKPKKIILDLTREGLCFNQDSYDKIATLLPYYDSNPEMREIIYMKSPYERLKLLSKTYPYNSMILPMLAFNTEFVRKRKTHYQGFEPLQTTDTSLVRKMLIAQSKREVAESSIDTVKTGVFKRFIEDCIQSKVGLVVIVSPYLLNEDRGYQSIQLARSICKEYNVDFLDYCYLPGVSDNVKYFFDETHLNGVGANEFSKIVLKYFESDNLIK